MRTYWLMGLCIPGCLYDSVRGPYDSQDDAEKNVRLELREYGNPNYIAEIFPLDFESEEELADYFESF